MQEVELSVASYNLGQGSALTAGPMGSSPVQVILPRLCSREPALIPPTRLRPPQVRAPHARTGPLQSPASGHPPIPAAVTPGSPGKRASRSKDTTDVENPSCRVQLLPP